ncbi:hypothetical protein NSPZN2_90002 [Nitrospira defluvii]|uniref:Uncharacterized protein n=1 Tax=Nitrospira defluvii TaxID=330214 RepID=A0ABM8SE94_9BACT|nr:hypothetical protein NSPZN2_90002 [Nitrospira defluvii]
MVAPREYNIPLQLSCRSQRKTLDK